jgi:uncharacterized lipoprotein YajG
MGCSVGKEIVIPRRDSAYYKQYPTTTGRSRVMLASNENINKKTGKLLSDIVRMQTQFLLPDATFTTVNPGESTEK